MDKIIYYIWTIVILLLIVNIVMPISTGVYNASVVSSIICSIIAYKSISIPRSSKLLILAYCVLLVSLLIAGVCNGTILGKTLSFIAWTIPFISMLLVNHLYGIQKYFIFVISILACILSILGLLSINTFDDAKRLVSLYPNPNMLANTLIQILPFSIIWVLKFYKNYLWQSIILLFTIIINGYVLIHTYSRGAITGFIIGGVIALLLYSLLNRQDKIWRRIAYIVGILFVSGVIYIGFNPSVYERSYDNERILLYTSSIEMWKDYPLVGVGMEQWKYYYKNHYISPHAKEPNLSHPHNTFLYFLTGAGIVGAFGYVLFNILCIVYVVRNYMRNGKNILYLAMLWVIIGGIVQGIVDISIAHRFAIHLYMMLLGYMVCIDGDKF